MNTPGQYCDRPSYGALGTLITNADQGVVYSWSLITCTANCVSASTQNELTTVGEDGSASTTTLNIPGNYAPQPMLQRADGSYVGTVYTDTGSINMVAFTSSGQQLWSQPNDTPQIATADCGIIGASGITYDQNGNVDGYIANMSTQSWTGYGYQFGSTDQVAFVPSTLATTYLSDLLLFNGTAVPQGPYPQLVSCLSPNTDCPNGWTSATGGPREWIYNGLKALEALLGTPCVPNSSNSAVQQACSIDTYVFTSSLKDANGNQGSRAAFLSFLGQDTYPSFYDGTTPNLPQCGYVSNCDNSTKIEDEFVGSNTQAATIIFDQRTPPAIPKMRTFFLPGAIYRELQGVAGAHDADNMAMVFHEALHAYTRLPDIGYVGLSPTGPRLKKMLGCNVEWTGTYDITAFLMQFTQPTAKQIILSCSEYSGVTPPTVPPQ